MPKLLDQFHKVRCRLWVVEENNRFLDHVRVRVSWGRVIPHNTWYFLPVICIAVTIFVGSLALAEYAPYSAVVVTLRAKLRCSVL